jgi:exodeoxyribonuclease X
MTAYVEFGLDFETTNVDPKIAKAVEVALIGGGLDMLTLVNPGCPIPPETSAIHHITDADVADAPSWDEVKTLLASAVVETVNNGKVPVFVAHNAQYEQGILGEFSKTAWVCTYKVALRLWPEAPNHKNETLRYWLGLGNLGRANSHFAHSAEHDARVTLQIYAKAKELASIEQMIEWSLLPGKLPKMPLGKHFGQEWNTIPAPYLEWCIKNLGDREDVVYCAKEELKRRRGG